MDTDMRALTATAERAIVIVERKNRSRMVVSSALQQLQSIESASFTKPPMSGNRPSS
jgi:hypothetical protein